MAAFVGRSHLGSFCLFARYTTSKCGLTYLHLFGSRHKSPDSDSAVATMLRAMYLAALLKRDTSSTLNGSAASSVRAPRAVEQPYGACRGPAISTNYKHR